MSYVLLVEDDTDIRVSVASLLEEDGFEVVEAANGADALAALQGSDPPNVIVMDLRMPVLDGWQLLTAIRMDARLARIPVVIASVATDSPVVAQARVAIQKPYQIDHLVGVVRELVSEQGVILPARTQRLARSGDRTFHVGPRLTATIAQLREQERAGRRMGFWIPANAAERLAVAIRADLGLEDLQDTGGERRSRRFRFGRHAQLELATMHFDADDADALESAIQADLDSGSGVLSASA